MLLRTVARPLLSAAFIGQGLQSLRNSDTAADTVRPVLDAARRLPEPVSMAVPADPAGVRRFAQLTAVAQIGAGALLAAGKLPRLSAAVLAGTVVPGRMGAHLFWREEDRSLRAQQRQALLADVSLLGGLLIASADTAGQPSLGWRGRQAAQRLSDRVGAVIPDSGDPELGERITRRVAAGAEHGRDLVESVLERSEPIVEAARQRGGALAGDALTRGGAWAEAAWKHGGEFAGDLAGAARGYRAEWTDAARRYARSHGPVKGRR